MSLVLVDKDHGLTGNLLVEHLDGARIDLLSKEEYAEVGSLGMQGNGYAKSNDITALDVAVSDLQSAINLANVDPIDVARNITGLNPETTLVVVVSKTFTTAETMLNARTLREWISSALGMESNGKGVSIDGVALPYESGEIDFGETGTNGQHSFYQFTR
ncbi:hypothetical protein RHGRI_019528 [Rhododendron griersonianum]|uniref:Uncharacterized protein n=1 Tax=Rhododendron griersonianum TaxID=479676 RepID=A0AAV6JE10_9ERIC|nr:hypothetical protein RHGRI_019528 [Rhododendron griersonianum]